MSIDVTKSIVYGRKFDREINYIIVNQTALNDTGYQHVYENSCIMLLQDDDRNSIIQVDGSSEQLSFTTAEIEENGGKFYTPGLICGHSISYRPLDVVKTNDEDMMRYLCNLNNEQNRNLDFVQDYCSDYVFIEEYVLYLTAILCGFCAVCITTYLVNQILILKIPFGREFNAYLIAIILIVICITNAAVIILC